MSVCRVICMYGSIVTGYVTSGAFRKSIDGFSTRTGPPEPFSIAEPTSDRLPASGESAAAASHMCGGAAATTSPLPLPALSTHRRGRLPLRRQRRRRGVRPFTDRCRRCLRRLGHRRGDRGRRNHQQGRLHRQPRDRCDHSPGCTTEPNGGERCVRLPKRGIMSTRHRPGAYAPDATDHPYTTDICALHPLSRLLPARCRGLSSPASACSRTAPESAGPSPTCPGSCDGPPLRPWSRRAPVRGRIAPPRGWSPARSTGRR